jgi:hypothetical protein
MAFPTPLNTLPCSQVQVLDARAAEAPSAILHSARVPPSPPARGTLLDQRCGH